MIAPQSIAEILGLGASVRTVRQDETEDTQWLARVMQAAHFAWDDRSHAEEWMSRPHRELSNQTPLETSRSEIGARQVESPLTALYFRLPV